MTSSDFFVRFFFYGFIVFEQKVQFRFDIFSVTSDLTIQCHRVGLEVKIYFHMRTLRASSGGIRASQCIFLICCVFVTFQIGIQSKILIPDLCIPLYYETTKFFPRTYMKLKIFPKTDILLWKLLGELT